MNTETPMDKTQRGNWTSASNAWPDSLCAGRHNAQLDIPDESSEDATFGQEIHDALKTDDTSKLSPEQLSIYESCVEIRTRLIEEVFGQDAAKVIQLRERRLWVHILSPVDDKTRFPHSGQADFIARLGPKALIVEYKALPGDLPSAPSNLQLRDQVVLAGGELKVSDAYCAVIQPLVTHKPELCRYELEAIKRAEAQMFQRVRNSNNPNAPRTAGEVQCKFCRARHACPERAALLEVATPMPVSALASVPVAEWTPEQRSLFCERRGMASKWLEECYDQMKKLVKDNPDAIPGFALKPGAVMTPIVKPEELHARFLAIGGTPEQFMSAVSIGKKEFEKAVRAATKLKGKALAAKLDELTDGLVEEKPNDSSLTRKAGEV